MAGSSESHALSAGQWQHHRDVMDAEGALRLARGRHFMTAYVRTAYSPAIAMQCRKKPATNSSKLHHSRVIRIESFVPMPNSNELHTPCTAMAAAARRSMTMRTALVPAIPRRSRATFMINRPTQSEMDGDKHERPIGGERVDLPRGEAAIQPKKRKSQFEIIRLVTSSASIAISSSRVASGADQSSRLAPCFPDRAIPSPVKDVVDDDQREQGRADQLMNGVA